MNPDASRLPGPGPLFSATGRSVVAALSLLLASGCTIITQDAYDFRVGDTGSGLDGGGLDGGAQDGGSDCTDPLDWHADDDEDGLGDPLAVVESCDQPDGYVDNADDCDDSDPDVGAARPWYLDQDDDGYGVEGDSVEACSPPSGYTDQVGDCDDDDDSVHPGAVESCATAADDDCDGQANVQDALDCTEFYRDGDGDGYGDDAGDVQCWCEPTGAYSGEDLGDCDPGDPDVNPGEAEDCFDGIDNDCDGQGCRMGGTWTPVEADGVYEGSGGGAAGESVTFLGDLDGDGTDDLGIGAPEQGAGGSAYVVTGPDLGIYVLESAAATIVDGESSGDVAGRGLAGMPDVHGDGYDELVVGAPSNNVAGTASGAVYLFHGPAAGALSAGDADATVQGLEAYHYAGRSLAGLLDATGDGVPDLLIGATGDDDGGNNSGAAYLLAGPVGSGSIDDLAVAKLTGGGNGDTAGRQVASAGDIDGDGLVDLLVGAHANDDGGNNAGAAYLVLGGVEGVLSLDDADAVLRGEAASDAAGKAVASAGDVDGDGVPDVLVGAPERASSTGSAYLVLGPVEGVVSLSTAWELTGEAEGDQAGTAVSSAGDLDRDGRAELLVGAPGSDRGAEDGGSVYLVYGSPGGGISLSDAEVVLQGSGGALGSSVAGEGDHDGDGTPDLLFGAPGFADGDGRVYLFRGEGL